MKIGIHDQTTVSRHADLIIEWARMDVAHSAYTNADRNPYNQHVRDAANVLPARVSMLACALAEARVKHVSGVSSYDRCYDPPTRVITPRNYQGIFDRIRRDWL